MILCLCPNPSVDKFIWLQQIKPGKVNRVEKVQSFPGGKGVHVALGITELGEQCALLGFWGGDTGKYIKEYCENKGIACYGPEVDEPSRTCITIRSNENIDGTELLEAGPSIDDQKIDEFWQEFLNLLNNASSVCMSGSWPPVSEKVNYADFVIAAKKKNIKSFVDCSGKHLKEMLKAKPYCVHINNHEAFEVFNEYSPLKTACLLLESCDLAAITYGAEGLYLANNTQIPLHANCKIDDVLSTVGCGDSLMAGLIVANERNLSYSDAAKLAVACGAANCLREELGMFHKKDVALLIEKAIVNSVDHLFNYQE